MADAAGVSVETIYNGFGSKKGLLRAAMDSSVVGDTEPVPFVERPEFRALGEGTFDERVERAIALVAEIHRRSSGVWLAVVEAVIGLTSGLEELPLVALILVIAGGLMAWAAILLVHQGWRSATITLNDVVVRSPFMRRWVPLAKVFAFQPWNWVQEPLSRFWTY